MLIELPSHAVTTYSEDFLNKFKFSFYQPIICWAPCHPLIFLSSNHEEILGWQQVLQDAGDCLVFLMLVRLANGINSICIKKRCRSYADNALACLRCLVHYVHSLSGIRKQPIDHFSELLNKSFHRSALTNIIDILVYAIDEARIR